MRIVIPSVKYADLLAVVLPAWQAFLPHADITVVTSTRDAETAALAAAYGVACCQTDVWYAQVPTQDAQDGPVVFNKAAALDEAFGFRGSWRSAPAVGDLCLSLDCDVVPEGTFPQEDQVKPRIIYSVPRYECPTPEALAEHQAGRGRRLRLIPPKVKGQTYVASIPGLTPREAAKRCLGFFQLFRYHEGLRFGDFKTAGGYDMAFRDQFQSRAALLSMHVLHLGEQHRENWKGRVVAPWATT